MHLYIQELISNAGYPVIYFGVLLIVLGFVEIIEGSALSPASLPTCCWAARGRDCRGLTAKGDKTMSAKRNRQGPMLGKEQPPLTISTLGLICLMLGLTTYVVILCAGVFTILRCIF